MLLCFFCMKVLSFPLSPPGMFPYLLDKLGSVWLHYGTWSQTKCYIYWKARLSPKHEEVGADPCTWILGVVLCMNQHSNVVLPLWLFSLGKVPSMLIRVKLNLSHWPLVCGWYELVHIFCITISSQRSATNWLSKFHPWSLMIFLDNP